MLKEIKDKEKLLNLNEALKVFLNNLDCKDMDCYKCEHKALCDSICALDDTLNKVYLKK